MAAVVCVPLGVVICVVASRAVAALAAGIGGGRRTREVVGLVGFALVIFASPLFIGVTNLLFSASEQGAQLQTVVSALSWTPVAAAWAVPGDLAAGRGSRAPQARHRGRHPRAAVGALAAEPGGIPRRSSGTRGYASPSGSLGWFGVMPSSPVGATWARSLTSWTRDFRYLRQLLLIPFAPVLVLVYSRGDLDGPFFAASGLLVGFFAGILAYTDVSYDGTAFATVLQTGIRGRARPSRAHARIGDREHPARAARRCRDAGDRRQGELLPAVIGGSLGLTLVGSVSVP